MDTVRATYEPYTLLAVKDIVTIFNFPDRFCSVKKSGLLRGSRHVLADPKVARSS